ncbi:MAG TPA: molybdenum cofactor biosynthesis protein MoaE [Spirochaetota bacterium]|nr:molybdenum cofactor biosynthesis protein MoaE [Spirochaetota bacterium]HPV42838.1 molybdenum cofactor biosynthesis protein MoaE [Spirochaetota bacterium]
MISIILQQEPIDAARVQAEAGTAADGAVVSFIGRVRDNSRGKTVTHIEYEAYGEMARKQLRKIVDEAVARWSLNSCSVVHRFGTVAVGEASIIIAASAPHRVAAFQAAQYIIDTIKTDVPIWKKEFYSDGSSWIDGKE